MTAPTQQRLTTAQLAAIVALLKIQTDLRQRLTQTAVAAALAPFQGFTNWWDAAAVSKRIDLVIRTLHPTQRQMTRQTDAFNARIMTILSGRTVRPVGTVDVTKLRRVMPAKLVEQLADELVDPPWVELGDDVAGPSDHIDDPFEPLAPADEGGRDTFLNPRDVYGRVADGVRYDIVANGLEEPKARQRAMVRIAAAADTDMTLAVRAQYYKALREGRTVRADGWRRVLRPELSRTGPCGLCVVASDRIYKTEDLEPIHDLCKCEILPIIGDLDPGLILNVDDLEKIYGAAGGTGGDVIKNGKRHSGRLKAIRVVLTEHGELGPVLVDGSQHVRGMRQVAKTQSTSRRHQVEAQIESLEKTFERLIARRRAGEDVDAPYEWQSHAIDTLRAELAQLV